MTNLRKKIIRRTRKIRGGAGEKALFNRIKEIINSGGQVTATESTAISTELRYINQAIKRTDKIYRVGTAEGWWPAALTRDTFLALLQRAKKSLQEKLSRAKTREDQERKANNQWRAELSKKAKEALNKDAAKKKAAAVARKKAAAAAEARRKARNKPSTEYSSLGVGRKESLYPNNTRKRKHNNKKSNNTRKHKKRYSQEERNRQYAERLQFQEQEQELRGKINRNIQEQADRKFAQDFQAKENRRMPSHNTFQPPTGSIFEGEGEKIRRFCDLAGLNYQNNTARRHAREFLRESGGNVRVAVANYHARMGGAGGFGGGDINRPVSPDNQGWQQFPPAGNNFWNPVNRGKHSNNNHEPMPPAGNSFWNPVNRGKHSNNNHEPDYPPPQPPVAAQKVQAKADDEDDDSRTCFVCTQDFDDQHRPRMVLHPPEIHAMCVECWEHMHKLHREQGIGNPNVCSMCRAQLKQPGRPGGPRVVNDAEYSRMVTAAADAGKKQGEARIAARASFLGRCAEALRHGRNRVRNLMGCPRRAAGHIPARVADIAAPPTPRRGRRRRQRDRTPSPPPGSARRRMRNEARFRRNHQRNRRRDRTPNRGGGRRTQKKRNH